MRKSHIKEHTFFGEINIPSWRYAKEQVAAQIVLNEFSRRDNGTFHRSRYIDLQEFFKAYSKFTPEDKRAILKIKGNLDKTVECFEKVKVFFKDSARFFFTLAQSYANINKIEEAIRAYGYSISLEPNDPESHNNLANLLSAVGRFDLAVKEFNTALNLSPNNATIHRNLGATYLGMKKPLNALEQFKKAVELEPSFGKDLAEIIEKIESVKDKLFEVDYDSTG